MTAVLRTIGFISELGLHPKLAKPPFAGLVNRRTDFEPLLNVTVTVMARGAFVEGVKRLASESVNDLAAITIGRPGSTLSFSRAACPASCIARVTFSEAPWPV